MPKHHINIDEETMDVLKRSTITETSVTLPPGQLERSLYTKVNKVLETAGGKWNKKAKAHVFPEDPKEALGMAIDKGAILDTKKATQAFYTPPEIARTVIQHASISHGHHVLEPSAGKGNIAVHLWPDGIGTHPINRGGRTLLIENDPKSCEVLRKEFDPDHVLEQDFLTVIPNPATGFDRVVMNPPFTGGQDIEHVTHAFKFLKPGGRLVAITSPSWQTKQDKKSATFRQLVEDHGRIAEEFSEGSFKESGANVRTLLVILDR